MSTFAPTYFRLRCPKCRTTQYTIERTGPSYATKSEAWQDKVMACLCGKRLYGQQIVDEYDRQKAEYEERRAAAARQKKQEARKRQKAKPKPKPKPKPKAAFVPPANLNPAGDMCAKDALCAYTGCANPARTRSKYCSRQCSNRNARERYAAKKKGA